MNWLITPRLRGEKAMEGVKDGYALLTTVRARQAHAANIQ